jgi:hypothetical protein
MQPSENAPFKLSPELAKKLAALSPAALEEVIKVAAKLMARRHAREATGQTDLTKKFDPNAKLLTDPEIDQLRQSATELIASGREAFPPKA